MKPETIVKTDSHDKHGAGRILRFWHRVEFFIPFDLEQQVMDAPDAEWAVQSWSVAALRRAAHPLWEPRLPAGRELTGFDVYFGVFDKSLLADVTRQVLRASMTPDETVEQEERGALEGLTCMAKLRMGPAGEPGLDDVSVSTAPWALGQIQHTGRLDALHFAAFEDGIEDLKEALLEFRRTRPVAWTRVAGRADPVMVPVPLSAEELLTLQALFEDWTGFRPAAGRDGVAAIVIRARSVEENPKKRGANARMGAERNGGPRCAADGDEDDDDDGPDTEEIEVEILNSFFARDIAYAIGSLEQGTLSPALRAYLAPLPEECRIDLYTASGRETILAALAPRRLPSAHWPGEPAHAMSLMQQFAINSLFERLEPGGVFSVNGPPGTGKTTLLRDVFAELITRRARALAGLSRAREAFADVVSVDFQDEGRCAVARLRPELTGFEMVVASSNNAAVENLSRDLPKSKALGKTGKTPWRDAQGGARVGYLRTVAHNIAARTAKGDYEKLDADDAPWGLVACVLGRKRNRTDFAFRLASDAGREKWAVKGFEPALHQSIWTWREKYAGPGFAAARAAFIAADRAVAQRSASLDRYAAVCLHLRGRSRAAFCADAADGVAQAVQAREAAQAALARLDVEQVLCGRQLDALREELRLLERTRPAWWLRWLRRERERAFQAGQADNVRQQRAWLARRREAEAALPDGRRRLQDAVADHARAQRALAEREQEWETLQREREALAGQFPRMAHPDDAAALEDPDWQIQGFWHDETLDTLRSELFVAALALHEAWLAEVLQNGGGFGGNLVAVNRLLGGKRLLQREHAQAIWQSLFMVVPVVSSTFASIATQFRDLGPDSLGWLFIDEAGQAVPQAAVGALWRARRAVVVGDPLQIEPVFTVPIKLIEALARNARLPSGRPVEPHLASVQNLADEANALGARIQVDGNDKWIGSPLRVHRRCVDPMFTIANQIAYRGKMIYFDQHDPALRLPPPDSVDVGPSAWVDIGGTAQDRQAVPEQIELVCRAIVELSLRTGGLPALYVISPFRRIKEAVARRLATVDWPAGSRPSRRTLRDWCRTRIGTVHTFQGKEESMVWMVLGCDDQTRGAAGWAAGKPNLFNVALTRAKHRFFLIGDAGLWGGLSHFADASPALLPRIRPDVFLRRIGAGSADAAAAPAGTCVDG
jgi:hypothetical protein